MRRLSIVLGMLLTATLVGWSPAGAADAGMTDVTLRFVGYPCDGCVVTATGESAPANGYNGAKGTKVRDGRVTISIPTDETMGVYFAVDNPKFGFIGAETLIVMQYPGEEPGARVTRKAARHEKKASACWAGTDQSETTLRIRLSTVRDRDMTGKSTKSLLAWAQPTVASDGGVTPTDKGRVLINGDLSCGS